MVEEALTLEDKVALLSGADFNRTTSLAKHGLPYLKVSDGPNGVRGMETGLEHFIGFPFHVSGKPAVTAATFPCATALAATWDRSLARKAGSSIARDGKSKNVSLILAPTINLIRDPRCGRTFEALSEDPFLTAHMALEWVRGAEDDQGILVTLKHLVGNECETNRHGSNVVVAEDVLRQVYLRPFEIIIKHKPDVAAIMMGYNSINGEACSSNSHLIRDIIRKDWGYEGLVMSDWFGTYKNKESFVAGLDLEMPGPAQHRTLEKVKQLLESSEIEARHIDEPADRVLGLIKRAKKLADKHDYPLFTEDERSKDVETSLDEDEAIRKVAVEVGTAACVLLKNEGKLLPIEPAQQRIKRVAIIGTPAESPALTGGGSAALNPHRVVTPLNAIRDHLAKHHPEVEVEYHAGCEVQPCIADPSIETHLNNKPIELTWHYTGDDSPIHRETTALPQYRGFLGGFKPEQSDKPFEIRAEFDITTTSTGQHRISLQAFGSVELHLSGPAIDNKPQEWSYEGERVTPGMMFDSRKRLETRSFAIVGKQSLHVKLVYQPPANPIMALPGGPSTAFRLGFQEAFDERKPIDEAAAAAAEADLAIVFTATGPAFESEGIDRANIDLPCRQNELVEAVAKRAGSQKVVVVNASGSAVAMPWDRQVGAIIQSWFGGQEAGNSLVNVLFGIGEGPSGRLPMTWPRDIKDHASFANFPTSDGHPNDVHYREGQLYGHRWYENKKLAPLWWFGHGLSYTSFDVNLVKREKETVTVQVKNVGERKGKHILQVYSQETDSARKLVGFGVTACLAPGASEALRIDLDDGIHSSLPLVIAESSNPESVLLRLK